ncbi:SET domain protein [Paramyrothecium foliicola]|nr:SET domain protein [Paramyrothecium foliicola]
MTQAQLSLESLPAWARLHDVSYHDVVFRSIEGKGYGLVSTASSSSAQPEEGAPVLLRVPRDLILSRDAVEEYAKVDHNFKQLLELAGHQSSRGDVLLYLLNHLVLAKRTQTAPRGGASTPWTEYIKFLAREIPVPTMWTDLEKQFLQGTSLETALSAKLSVLENEFDELLNVSSTLPYWTALLWEDDGATLSDWILADAWYRSRCLELPQSGNSMVPVLDMVNHSHEATAYYEEDADGNVHLCLRPVTTITQDEEVTISYGTSKPAAEMLFSYGFIDKHTTAQELTLQVDPFPDDPLGKAKTHIFGQPGIVKLSEDGDACKWESPFAHLACLNEEDGLEFRVLQDNEGNRQLKLFWQGDDVTSRAKELEALLENHPLRKLFKLRVVTVIQERVATQLQNIQLDISEDQIEQIRGSGLVRHEVVENTNLLRRIETGLLAKAEQVLEAERNELLEDADVLAYLRGADEADNTTAPAPGVDDDEDDFS